MSCEKYLYLIDELVEGELDAQTAERVEAHVFTCLKCRRQYEAIKREKNVYAHYLFDAEPPHDLWANFQTWLATEKIKNSHVAEKPANASAPKTTIRGFWRLSPLLAGAALMIVFGIGISWLKFVAREANVDIRVAKTEAGDLPSPSPLNVTGQDGTANSPVKIKGSEKNTAFTQNNKLSGKDNSSKIRKGSVSDKKSPFIKAAKPDQKTVSADGGRENELLEDQSDEEVRRQKLQMKNLENEIAGQIEKVELLLRSFRNARATEANETFDIAYEKRQARNLLEKNGRLRRDAETYRILYAEELLDRVEPYLLDIANLADRPAPDKVLEIRERVKNQSVIASLQTY